MNWFVYYKSAGKFILLFCKHKEIFKYFEIFKYKSTQISIYTHSFKE